MINKRQFLKYLCASGMGISIPCGQTFAQSASPNRFWITVNANGGWDPTMVIDPKGNSPRPDDRGPINNYSAGAIDMAGNIPYVSAYPDGIEAPSLSAPGHYANFFPKHASRLLVINGIDTQTNNHDAGRRYVWGGDIDSSYPSFTALAAASSAPNEPLSFISNGGYDNTSSLVAPARVGDGGEFVRLAFPNASFPAGDPGNKQEYFTNAVYAEIEAARQQRISRLYATESLPLRKRQILSLQDARSGNSHLNRLFGLLPEQTSSGLRGQAEVATAAFAAGVAVSANLNLGGFDTHGEHDVDHSSSMTTLLDGIDHLWSQIERHNLEEKVTVLIGSEFGRTPFYNEDGGKDHWNVTSMMAMGAGVRGNRVVGGTNSLFEAESVNPESLELDEQGVTLTPKHIHQALRQMAGVDSGLNRKFSIADPYINLFG